MDSTADDTLARLLSHEAHALRNHVATLRSVAQLVEDEELEAALSTATCALQVAIERSVACARLDLGEPPTSVQLPVGELVALALRRARREGAQVDHEASGTGADLVVDVPGSWAERIIADLLHHVAGAPGVWPRGDEVVVEAPLLAQFDATLEGALGRLAIGCGGVLELEDGFARLVLPVAALSEG